MATPEQIANVRELILGSSQPPIVLDRNFLTTVQPWAQVKAIELALLNLIAEAGGIASIESAGGVSLLQNGETQVAPLARLRGLVAGANITLTPTGDDVTIAAAGGSAPQPSTINTIAAAGATYNIPEDDLEDFDLVRLTANSQTTTTINVPAATADFRVGLRIEITWTNLNDGPAVLELSAPGLPFPGGSSLYSGVGGSLTTLVLTLKYEGNNIWSWLGSVQFAPVV